MAGFGGADTVEALLAVADTLLCLLARGGICGAAFPIAFFISMGLGEICVASSCEFSISLSWLGMCGVPCGASECSISTKAGRSTSVQVCRENAAASLL